jgi:hypothetical protein
MKELFGAGFSVAVIGIWLATVVGWIMNIVAFVQTLPLLDTLQIARAAGIVLAPLGSILGLFA